MLPQKRNPDAAELIRAKAGRVAASLNGLLMVLKGLPLAYSKDMQEDKVPVFETADTLVLSLAAMSGMFEELEVDQTRMLEAAEQGNTDATDLADWLVKSLNRPFRDAHHITGQLVKSAEAKGSGLKDLTLEDMKMIDPDITEEFSRYWESNTPCVPR